MDDRKRILWQSLVLTILIFACGILLNHFFDVFRIATISDVMQDHEIDREAYTVERLFAEEFGGETCEVMTSRIFDFKEEIRQVGEDLGSYSRFSFFRKKDYDYLKRKYFLLELKFLSLIKRANLECDKPYLPIVFFYEIDDEDSERQGFILQELSRDYEQELIVLSLDLEYEDEPLLDTLVDSYGITSGPSLVIDETVHEGILYGGQINASIQKFLRRPDPFAGGVDFNLVTRAAGANVSRLLDEFDLIENNESASFWARGDAALISARLSKNYTAVCDALPFFDKIDSSDPEELAIKFETLASLGCGRNRRAFLRAAAGEWDKVNNTFRADLLRKLAASKRLNLRFDEVAVSSSDQVISGYFTPLVPTLPRDASAVVIGNSSIDVSSDSRIVSQTDRVFRDWLGGQLQSPFEGDYLKVFSERLYWNESELRSDIGWHEGARVSDLVNATGAEHKTAVGTLVARRGERWFAVDDKGVFSFEVPLDKVYYPTTRFLRQGLAVMIDSHGVNTVVEQALRYNATHVLSDCDHPGKVYAAKFLSDRGVDVICYPDKYLFTAIGHNLSLVGSAPFRFDDSSVTVGSRPMRIDAGDIVVSVNSSDDAYALWYYQTPASYMEQIERVLPLDITYVSMDDFGQMARATDRARQLNASVLAARVFSKDDYEELKAWLAADQGRRVILFHSASYPYGQMLFNEFVNQTSFDDPNPVWVNATY